jgi:hypothetical protein
VDFQCSSKITRSCKLLDVLDHSLSIMLISSLRNRDCDVRNLSKVFLRLGISRKMFSPIRPFPGCQALSADYSCFITRRALCNWTNSWPIENCRERCEWIYQKMSDSDSWLQHSLIWFLELLGGTEKLDLDEAFCPWINCKSNAGTDCDDSAPRTL